jgi:F0F1-type ATP synthase epsilon subunit
MALGEHELDEEDVIEQALERAQKAMEEKSDPEDVAAAQVLIQKQLAKLHVKRRRRRRL